MIDLNTLTIPKAAEGLQKGDFTVRALTDAYLANIEQNNETLNIYLHLFSDIDQQVEKAQSMIDDGSATELTGIPMSLKANIMRKGEITNCASKMLEHYRATYTATAVERLEQQGVVFLGSTNMDEFAMGGSTENSAFGPTKNPHDPARVPGGTSGGAAASVAAQMALVGIGSDTGGSIRQPASFCGTVGFKGSYGSVSRYGAVAMGSSLDQISPAADTVADAALVWSVMKGNDPHDMTTLTDNVWTVSEQADKQQYRIAIPRQVAAGGVDDQVLEIFNKKIDALKEAGHQVEEIDVPELDHVLSVYYIIMPAEVSSNLARFDGMRYGSKVPAETMWQEYKQTRSQGFGPEAKRRIMLGTYVLSAGYADAYYEKALALREQIRQKLRAIFSEYDVVATPTSPVPPFMIGEKSKDPVSMYLADIFTVTANIAGLPAISIPAGSVEVNGKSLPVGIQFMAGSAQDRQLLDFAKKVESNS